MDTSMSGHTKALYTTSLIIKCLQILRRFLTSNESYYPRLMFSSSKKMQKWHHITGMLTKNFHLTPYICCNLTPDVFCSYDAYSFHVTPFFSRDSVIQWLCVPKHFVFTTMLRTNKNVFNNCWVPCPMAIFVSYTDTITYNYTYYLLCVPTLQAKVLIIFICRPVVLIIPLLA